MTEQNIIIKGRSYAAPLILVIALLLAVIIWMAKCGGNRSVDPQIAALKKQKAEDSIKYIEERTRYEDSLMLLEAEKDLQKSILIEKDKNLAIMGKQIDKLREDFNKLEKPLPTSDSNKYLVSAQWINTCAHCISLLEKHKDTTKALVHAYYKLVGLYKEDSSLKQNRIKYLEQTVEKKDKEYNGLIDIYAASKKPKTSMAVGIEAMYSSVVSNIGGWITLKDKRGKIYGIDYGINTLQKQYFGIRAGFTLFGN